MQLHKLQGQQLDVTSAVKGGAHGRRNRLGPPIQTGYHAGSVTAHNKQKNHRNIKAAAISQGGGALKHLHTVTKLNRMVKTLQEQRYTVLDHRLGL